MQRTRSFRNNALAIIFVLILIVIGYIWYSYFQSKPGALVEGSGASLAGTEGSSEFLALLAILEKLTIDTSFFEDPLFRGLGEKTELPPLPSLIGRANPFAPLK